MQKASRRSFLWRRSSWSASVGGCPLACIPNARARQNEKWHVHLNSPITVQENVERRSQAV
jgi:hypothetical protein